MTRATVSHRGAGTSSDPAPYRSYTRTDTATLRTVAGEPRIRDDRDPELTVLAEAAAEARAAVTSLYNRCVDSWDSSLGRDLKCEHEKSRGGFVFRVPRRHEKALRDIPDCVVLAVLKDGVYFTTGGKDGLRRRAAAVEEAEAAYTAASRALIMETIAAARTFCPLLEAAGG